MNRSGKVLSVIFLIILIALLIGSLWFLYQNLPGALEVLKPNEDISDEDIGGDVHYDTGDYTESEQFYDNMRFPDREITYYVSRKCSDEKFIEVDESLGIIGDNTVLNFVKSSNSMAQFKVLCSGDAPEPVEKGHFVAGEGGPMEVINTSLFAVIRAGQISLYREDKCDTAHIALHEALHVLGFDHNDNPGSILFPTLDCDQEVDDYLWQEINRLYEKPGYADLKISDVAATKSGRYLNFDIEVVNQGLKMVEGAKLRVYGDGKIIKFKDAKTQKNVDYLALGNVEVGTTKIFNVENSKLSSRGVDEIRFVVDEEDIVKELFEDNNVVIFSV